MHIQGGRETEDGNCTLGEAGRCRQKQVINRGSRCSPGLRRSDMRNRDWESLVENCNFLVTTRKREGETVRRRRGVGEQWSNGDLFARRRTGHRKSAVASATFLALYKLCFEIKIIFWN